MRPEVLELDFPPSGEEWVPFRYKLASAYQASAPSAKNTVSIILQEEAE